jgi:predicted metal-dependent hydrolase
MVTLEERYQALDKLVRRLEDGLAVEATLADRSRDRQQAASDRHEQWLQDHQAAMEAHNRAMQRHEEWLRHHNAAIEEHDRRMIALDEKLDRIADMLGFRGGNGSQ